MIRLISMLAALLAVNVALAAEPAPFHAEYEVLRAGKRIGETRMSLSRDGGDWVFVSDTRGTAGLAAMLGIDVTEISRFRWQGGAPRIESYRYTLKNGLKNRSRTLDVDWASRVVTSHDSRKGDAAYGAREGMVENNLLTLLLGARYAADPKAQLTIPVASRDGVHEKSFRAVATETVSVPAGRYTDALRIERTDRDQGFRAWYVPGRYPVPVKLAQGDKLELRLIDYRSAD